MVTIKDIAKMAKVSDGTVDRVIHNRGGVSKKTEERIRKILKENNFKVNPIARTLALRKKYKISCLIPKYDNQNLFWKSPSLGIHRAEEEIISYGIQTNIHKFNQFDPNTYRLQFHKMLKTNPDAVVIAPTFYTETKELVKELEKRSIPYSLLNIDIDGLNNISFIGQDSYHAGYAVGKLMGLCLREEQSCVTIQTRSNISNYSAIYQRIKGFEKYLTSKSNNIQNHHLIFQNLDDLNEVRRQVNKYLEEHKEVKGIYVPSSRVSILANVIAKDKLASLFIIGFDTTTNNLQCLQEGKISFLISQKSFDQGYYAIKIMADFLSHKKIPKDKIFSPIQIIIKENLIYNDSHEPSHIFVSS
ncbi:substrate-binding domain-containing protein [Flagellimonas olearia]|uniref:Substrate-binding domain-containing protein n=1 Tax=Flagellimonas olearia TaxID=552546 RepID=A0A6I1E1R7_9FLAO|nr:LacI family DNA-binding transcriptional regulator [Allomuricauda olearia]KAB7530379.1 substrate-binding domain-containing protein [Allomuricauda olearia]